MGKQPTAPMSQGSFLTEDGSCLFRVWAPKHDEVSLKLLTPQSRKVPMAPVGCGYHEATVQNVGPGARYMYELSGDAQRPDPASRSQPDGVHGPSEVVDQRFEWTDSAWTNPTLDRYVIYELHVGTFSSEGTFDGVIPYLQELRDLGVTAIELMPVAQFPGERNWGYDGVYPFSAQSSYGGVSGLKRLVDAAHQTGLAVVLDVVYNHLGPEGNYLADFGPYFSAEYSTPWGHPINFDGRDSDEVRRYFIDNALYWTGECRIDALRFDAIHAIYDFSARTFLRQLADEVHERANTQGRTVHLIAESALNDPRVVWDEAHGGLAMDAHWNDDFHHALHVALTDERRGYYTDFNGLPDLVTALNEGYVYQGQRSEFRGRSHGAKPVGVAPSHLTVFSQNHDQVGNRAAGDRLTASLSHEQLKLAAGITLLSPFMPLLFMGEEYGETAPFPYFISHTDDDLVEAVRRGRRQEFAEMLDAGAHVPDPQAEQTFLRAKLDHSLATSGRHTALRDFYRELLTLRRDHPALQEPDSGDCKAELIGDYVLSLRRSSGTDHLLALFNFSGVDQHISESNVRSDWTQLMDSSAERWGGAAASPGVGKLAPYSFQVFEQSGESGV